MNSHSIADVLEVAISEVRTYGKVKDHFRMSGLGTCPLRQIAERAGLEPTLKVTKQARFKMWTGTVIGHEIQAHLEKDGFLEADWHEKEVHLGSYVGHTDGLTKRVGTKPKIVETKTADDDAVTSYPWPTSYFWQGFGYCMSQEAQTVGVDGLLLLQIGKNQGCSREEVFLLKMEWRNKITREIKRMDKLWGIYVKTGVLPPHLHRHGWENKYCPYPELGEKKLGQAPAAKKYRSHPYGDSDRNRELARWLDAPENEKKQGEP